MAGTEVELLSYLRRVCEDGFSLLRDHVAPQVGHTEAAVASLGLAILAARHAEGAVACGERGAAGVPPMAACARSALECGLTGAWIMAPEDVWEREGRWLGFHKAYARYLSGLAKEVETNAPEIAANLRESARVIEDWRVQIEAKLPSARVVSRPPFAQLLEEFGLRSLYMAYRMTSQLVHGEPPGLEYVARTEAYRDDPSDTSPVSASSLQRRSFGDFASTSDVATMCRVASFGVKRGCGDLAVRLGVPEGDIFQLYQRHSALLLAADVFEQGGAS